MSNREQTSTISKRYDALDGIRVLAMTGILVMHVLANLSYREELSELYSYIKWFVRMTSLFMMVSAFSVSCGYYFKIQQDFKSIENFYNKRYQKILPFFAFLTVVDVVLSFSKESIFEGFANLTLVFGFIPHESITVIGVGWTLGVIFVFYLLYPFVVYLMKNKIRFNVAFVITLIYAFIVNEYFGLEKMDFLYCACYFMGGAWLFLNKERIEKHCKRTFILPLVIAMLILFYVCVFHFKTAKNIVQYILFVLIIVYAIIVSGHRTILSNRVMKFLSSISLEIYLCHMMLFRIVEKLHLTHVFSSAALSFALVSVIVFVGSVCFSVMFQKVYAVIKNRCKKAGVLKSKHQN